MVAIFEVELLYEWNELGAAERLLHTHRQIIEECGLVVHEMACKLHIARLAAARGRHDEALAVLERAERLGLQKRYQRLTASALNDRVRLLLARGDARSARWALRARGVEDGPRPLTSLAAELEATALARVLIAEDRPDAALRILDQVAERVRQEGRLRRLAQVRAISAIAAYRAGDALTALAAAVDTVSLCAPQNALRILIDEGPGLRDVLAVRARPGAELVRRHPGGTLYRSRHAAFAASERNAAATPVVPRRSPRFSQREAEVARLLTAGHSNRDLARTLGMAPDTVKWHLKNIFGKLGVANRTQAVLRLQEIGLGSKAPGLH